MSRTSADHAAILTGIVANVVSVVGIVICNKYITEIDKFNYMIFLSLVHFVFTSVGTRVLLYFKVFSYSPAAITSVLPLAMGSLLSVAFMNLNLANSSVGFYQLSKLACIPFTLFIQYIFYKQTVSRIIMMTLFIISFGVGYATVYDLDVRFISLVFATCAVVATSMAQIFTNTYQKSLDCNAMQLLYHTSPLITIGMAVMCPFFDDVPALLKHEYTTGCIIRILVSCVFALGVNISNYVVLGRTSPLTYQVLGHMKTVLILVLGFTMFNKPIDLRNIMGITVAMAGVIAYTEVKRRYPDNGSKPTETKKETDEEQESMLKK
eukprot:gene5773-11666_t